MRHSLSTYVGRLVLAAFVSFTACAKVPPEAARLSSTLGEDIVATQTSYQLLISAHFDNLRNQVDVFVDTRWRPVFLQRFVESGNLVGRATDPDPVSALNRVNNWAQVAIERIDAKRKELRDPIDADEQALRVVVADAFNRMVRANATVTAHLNSIAKVNDVQDGLLQAAGIKELRDGINRVLIDASMKTQAAIDQVVSADELFVQPVDKP
jgi:hypothetical protein